MLHKLWHVKSSFWKADTWKNIGRISEWFFQFQKWCALFWNVLAQSLGLLFEIPRKLLWREQHWLEGKCCCYEGMSWVQKLFDCTVYVNGHVNTENDRCWSTGNPCKETYTPSFNTLAFSVPWVQGELWVLCCMQIQLSLRNMLQTDKWPSV